MKRTTRSASPESCPADQPLNQDHPVNKTTHAIEMETMETALAAARVGVFELDLVSDTSNVSATWRDLMDVSSSDKVDFQAEWRKRVHPDDEMVIERALADHVSGRTSHVAVEYRLRSPDGLDWLWMRTDAQTTRWDAQGNALNLVGTQRDITDRKRAELALQGSEKQFRSLMNNAPIGTAVVSLEGKWLATNAAMTAFVGYSEEELRCTDFQSITHEDDLQSCIHNVQKLLSGEVDAFKIDKRYVRPDGEVVWGHLCVVLVRSESGQPMHYIAQVLDITENRKLDFLRSEFMSIIAHELRTPVTAIAGALDMLDLACSSGSIENAQKLVKIAKRGSDRLRSALEDILDFEQVSGGALSPNLTETNIIEVIKEALLKSQTVMDKHRASARLLSQEDEISCPCDPVLLDKVLKHLLSNAAKFSPEGREAWVIVTKCVRQISIRVKDSGPGIPDNLHQKVFQPFWQQDTSDTRDQQGIGLGLTISRRAIRKMGGELSIKACGGSGAEFLITLPAYPSL
ncbi:PAS domain S-box protein [Sulfitobacter sp. S0837]|uniref:PAS domain-containing sensor histidine kinase n=1 Tax=Sulfitobacter maritimus TaxID=2741719 RepID=UPI001583B28B|nr:PAS domain-containing sensor histidine kinase [Sulfitobacter maritimus]NUH63978.1 PAS domain S-box protein [Sulfitobacter maritimus]